VFLPAYKALARYNIAVEAKSENKIMISHCSTAIFAVQNQTSLILHSFSLLQWVFKATTILLSLYYSVTYRVSASGKLTVEWQLDFSGR